MNVFGERQNPEKYIPMVIKSKNNKLVTVHANSEKTKKDQDITSMQKMSLMHFYFYLIIIFHF